jgi:hypothetical protein
MDSKTEHEAKKILIQQKHGIHEEMLRKTIEQLQYNLEHYDTFDGLESIFAHVKANAQALLFLCQERKRDRDKRADPSQPVNPIPSPDPEIK